MISPYVFIPCFPTLPSPDWIPHASTTQAVSPSSPLLSYPSPRLAVGGSRRAGASTATGSGFRSCWSRWRATGCSTCMPLRPGKADALLCVRSGAGG